MQKKKKKRKKKEKEKRKGDIRFLIQVELMKNNIFDARIKIKRRM